MSAHTLLKKIDSDTIIITPNNRLTQELLHHYYALKQTSSAKPRFFSYSAFLAHLHQIIRHQHPDIEHPMLLSPAIVRQIWHDTILKTQSFCNAGLLDAVINAWDVCQNWQVNTTDKRFDLLRQHTLFQQWRIMVEKKIKKLGALTETQLPTYIQQFLPQQQWANTLIWYCFDAFTPSQKSLQMQFKQHGIIQIYNDLPLVTHESYKIEAKETEEEYQQLITWIQQKKAENKKRIGIVVPDLETESTVLLRRLLQYFPAEDINISLGRSLITYPIIAHAITWLTLNEAEISTHQLSLLFSSPYLVKANQEGIERASWLQNTPFVRKEFISLAQLITHLPTSLSYLKEALDGWVTYPKKATIHEWIQYFEHRLISLGFPGESSLDSNQYQCYQRFIHLFDEFREFQLLTLEMTQEKALQTITTLAQQILFQPKTSSAPIQVLGLLEASGCTFDCIWIAHTTDQQFPQKGHLSAFIPLSLQRELDMPHANPEREIKFASQIFQRLTRAANECVFSYALLKADAPCMPSPLLQRLVKKTLPLAQETTSTALIPYEENYHLPLTGTQMIGGTALLANQAKCPFRAFAAHRLHLKRESDIIVGLTPQERGQIVHQILEKLWQRIQSQACLITYPPETLTQLIQQSIQETLVSMKHTTLPDLIKSVENKRLETLIQACLDWEKTRTTFTIAALEKTTTLELAGLTFHIKLDRLDQLASGEKWVIDYKSRFPAQKPWLEERPEEPQLLLYALAEVDVTGLLFLELRHGQVNCSGFSTEATHLTGIKSLPPDSSWEEHHQRWHRLLNQLAEEFKAGLCIPKPTRASICQTCEFQSVCRTS